MWKHSNFQPSSSDETFQLDHQPGGTATVVLDRWTPQVVAKRVDPYCLGRWSYITLRGSNNKLTRITTGQRVCIPTSTTVGVKTAYMQQYRCISWKFCSTEQSSTPNPRGQFILDLQACLENLVKEGHLLIFSLDSNKDLDISKANFCLLS